MHKKCAANREQIKLPIHCLITKPYWFWFHLARAIKEVTLFFPTNTQMAEFLSTGKITGAQADPGEQTLQTSRPMKKSL